MASGRAWLGSLCSLGTLCMVGGVLLVPGTAQARRTVFINLDPEVLVNTNGQDPTTNSYNTTGFTPGPISGWPTITEDDKTELLYWFKEASVPFDIVYTFDRPPAGTQYDMVVTGTAADNMALFPGLGCSGAIGLADCSDGNLENVSFLFYGCMNAADQANMHRVAFTAFAAMGFGWGLENLTGTGQIMAGYSMNALQFGNTCSNISGGQICPGQHPGCSDPQQNSTSDLMARIGPRVDDGPPVVTFLAPMHGEVVQPAITVNAAVGDLFGGLEVQLEIVEVPGMVLVDERPPYEWNLAGIPQGTWTLRVTAIDADMNVTVEEIQVCVDLPECGVEPPDGSTGADDTAGATAGDEFTTEVFEPETSTSTGAGSSTGPDTVPPPLATTTTPSQNDTFGNEPDVGCQCRANDGSGGPWPGLLGLLMLGAFTRRE
ncbi:hypothetical protein [Paraliomyxa miuraensis]|uniref:hypothetical protein n=1 Tax=Paraliomyxa miuraensis TaxID=376150 RepID=UPI002258A198|nr:hypothetical protein [Paraliomyxa miuraensis]MCX4242846.1 hypothetical protein [Paraliomyxa miuraensis]